MQERFEENSPQIPSSTSAIPLPSGEPTSETERLFTAAWKSGRYTECRELLPQMPPQISKATLNTVLCITRYSRFTSMPTKGSAAVLLRTECLRYLAQSPTPSRLMELTPLLFNSDREIQEMTFDIFQKAGRDALPALMSMQSRLQALNPRSKASQRGVVHLIQLFKELKCPQSTDILGDILLGKAPQFVAKRKLNQTFRCTLQCSATLLVSGSAIWASRILLPYNPEAFLIKAVTEVLYASLLVLFGVFAFILPFFTANLLFLLPAVLFVEYGVHDLFQAEALAAMESIGDKRALIPLMLFSMNGESKPKIYSLILKLLPLIEEQDNEWLSEIGCKWLLKHLHMMQRSQSTLTLLRATAILGDERLIHTVARVSQSKSPEVRAEAMRVLAVLESRRDSQQERRELLRASAMPDDYKETLLRPLQDRRDPQEEQELLHPVERPEE